MHDSNPNIKRTGFLIGACTLCIMTLVGLMPLGRIDPTFYVGIHVFFCPITFMVGGYIGAKSTTFTSITRGAIHGAVVMMCLVFLLLLAGSLMPGGLGHFDLDACLKISISVIVVGIAGAIPGAIGGVVGQFYRKKEKDMTVQVHPPLATNLKNHGFDQNGGEKQE